MKVAVFHSSRAICGEATTGSGSFDAAMYEVFESGQLGAFEFIHLVPAKGRLALTAISKKKPYGHDYGLNFFEAVLSHWPSRTSFLRFGKFFVSRLERALRARGVGGVIFLGPSSAAILLSEIPYLYTMWDLGHRELIGFPEAWRLDEWLRREKLYSITLPRASCVFVDSQKTGLKLERHYGVERERWLEIGLLPTIPNTRTFQREINGPYVIYPAARWPHKNHLTLIRAFPKVLESEPRAKLVFTGRMTKFARRIEDEISRLGIGSSVISFPELRRERVLGLISHSNAVVMPSLLGPTNLPPLEALALGVPAIVSDKHHFCDDVSRNLVRVASLDSDAWATEIVQALRFPRVVTPPECLDLERAIPRIRDGLSLLAQISDATSST